MLSAILQAEIAALSELERLLILELGALKARRLEELESLIAAKQRCVEQCARYFQERCAHLVSHGFEIGHSGTDSCIDSNPVGQRRALRGLWVDLRELGARTRHRNEINGAIMAASRSHTERALAVLQGRDVHASLYGQDAQSTIDSPSQPLARV